MKTYKPTQILISAQAHDNLGALFSDALMISGFNSKIVGRHENLLHELHAGSYSVLILTNNAFGANEVVELIPYIKVIDPNIKIILLSGWNQENFSERILAAGASHFFPLPIELDIVVDCVKKII